MLAGIRFLLFVLLPGLYLATLAQTLVLGDPTEYTFVANILGIAHPPGYAFITLTGKLFQMLIPFGEFPWRMHLLSATAATLGAVFVYGILLVVDRATMANKQDWVGVISAVFGALLVGTAVDYWQHAIHTNPHIITATFLAANLFLLTRWGYGGSDKWLYLFCVSAGLGVTHHPLTVFAFPAYTVYILVKRPSILREWRTLLKMVGFALLGLSVWLYFPIRSPMQPPFGPSTMNTLDGFLAHVLARNLRVNLFHFGLADQPDRLLVFWTLSRLQYSLPVLLLAVWGLVWLVVYPQGEKRPFRPLAILYGLAWLGNYLFVINTVQDVMAYLLGPFLIVGLLAAIGLYGLATLTRQVLQADNRLIGLLLAALFLLGPILQIARNTPYISLRNYNEGQAYVDAVFDWFAGRGEGAVLLNDWEHMTPLWYTKFVTNRWPDPADVRPEFVSTARPWVESVFDFLPGGPVYLSNYRREIVDAGFRLRPAGPFYQVVEPGDSSIPPELTPVRATGGEIEVVGYALPQTAVTAGDYVPFTLAMRTPTGTADFYVPVLFVGDITYPFTTDSHLITPQWLPGEVIVERFDFALPHNLPAGNYPVRVGLKNLSTNEEFDLGLTAGTLTVTPKTHPVRTDDLLANFRQRVGLVSATAWGNGRRVRAPWTEPLVAQPGNTIHITLRWRSLDYAEESYTVFVHLIDGANQPIVALDYTPLGGATPTHLWIPKWLPGQQMLDPYRLQIPDNLPPGTYYIEVGLYEMVGKRRLHIADENGNLIGDRYILGTVLVTE